MNPSFSSPRFFNPLMLWVDVALTTNEMLLSAGSVIQMRTERMAKAGLSPNEVDLAEFVQRHDAAVVLYDIAIPYDENWRALQERRAAPALATTPFVVTTTNQRALEGVVGPTDAVEIIGKPYDLHRIVEAVRRAAGRQARHAQ